MTLCMLFCLPLLSLAQTAKSKVSPDLLRVQTSNGANVPLPGRDELELSTLFQIIGNAVAIEAAATNGNGQELLQKLQALGLRNGVAYDRVVSGYLPIDQVNALQGVDGLQLARPSYAPQHNVGAVTSQGDKSLKADIARTTYNVTGAGSKVGVLSDSYNNQNGAAAGVASGDLPAGVQVIQDNPSGGTDEGRAMAEIVHDVAPGAAIAFNTANGGQASFAQGIKNLASAGCNIIVDDVIYFAEPFFQDGIIAQAVDDVTTNKNVSYFSSAGNQARSSYMAAFKNSGVTIPGYGVAHDFGGGSIKQRITIPAKSSIQLALQWDDPFFSVSGAPGAQTDIDMLVYTTSGSLLTGSYSDNLNGDPFEYIGLTNNGTSAASIDLVFVKYAGPDPGIVKWVNFGSRSITVQFDTKSGASFGHSGAAGANCVGAAPYYNTPAFNSNLTTATIETFSSAGGTPVLFTKTGQRINGATGTTRQKPDITSVDGGNTTFFYPGSDYESDGFPNFFGTSAAAPHAAAVAALLQEKAGNSLSPATISSILKQTALDMNDPSTPGFDTGFDYGTGYGFIQADKALQSITPPPGTFAITGVTTVTCATVTASQRTLTFTPQYSGLNGQPVSFSVVNEMLPTTGAGPYTLNLYTDNPVITLKATQTGTSLPASYAYNWLDVCGGSGSSNPPSSVFDITGVTTVSCATIASGQRLLTFSPQYSGLNGQPVSFSVVNEMLPTTAAGPYTLKMYTDNPVITLKATQTGTPTEAIYTYNWLVACGFSLNNARLGAEPGNGLQVRVLGNPISSETADIEISGVPNQLLKIELMDSQGRVHQQRTISQAGAIERISLPVGNNKGLLLLQVGTPIERQTIKLIKQ